MRSRRPPRRWRAIARTHWTVGGWTRARWRDSSSSSAVCSTPAARWKRKSATIRASARRSPRRAMTCSRPATRWTRRPRRDSVRRPGRRCVASRPTSAAPSSITSRGSTVRQRRSGARRLRLAVVLLIPLAALNARAARAQEESPVVMRALDLETAGRNREAAQLFRSALHAQPNTGALLGLERVYAELGMSDSLLPALDTLIAARPREALYRTVQLRTLQILRRDDQLRAAFERWTRDVARDP